MFWTWYAVCGSWCPKQVTWYEIHWHFRCLGWSGLSDQSDLTRWKLIGLTYKGNLHQYIRFLETFSCFVPEALKIILANIISWKYLCFFAESYSGFKHISRCARPLCQETVWRTGTAEQLLMNCDFECIVSPWWAWELFWLWCEMPLLCEWLGPNYLFACKVMSRTTH